MMKYVLAVDGGNTKTLAIVVDRRGGICGIGQSGSRDIYNAVAAAHKGQSPVEFALSNLDDVVSQAMENAGILPSMIETSLFNLAGADRPEDFQLLESAMKERHYGERISVQNDSLGILEAYAFDGMGGSIVCGTGGATGAIGRNGLIWHSGFWQSIGGSRDLSRQVVDAARSR